MESFHGGWFQLCVPFIASCTMHGISLEEIQHVRTCTWLVLLAESQCMFLIRSSININLGVFPFPVSCSLNEATFFLNEAATDPMAFVFMMKNCCRK